MTFDKLFALSVKDFFWYISKFNFHREAWKNNGTWNTNPFGLENAHIFSVMTKEVAEDIIFAGNVSQHIVKPLRRRIAIARDDRVVFIIHNYSRLDFYFDDLGNLQRADIRPLYGSICYRLEYDKTSNELRGTFV